MTVVAAVGTAAVILFAFDVQEEMGLAALKIFMCKRDGIRARLTLFMEAIKVQLSYEGAKVAVTKIFRQDLIRERVDLQDDERFAVGIPSHN